MTKIEHLFMIKTLSKLGLQRNFLNLVNGVVVIFLIAVTMYLRETTYRWKDLFWLMVLEGQSNIT
jgi:hypothetical protein